jgi:hypothetical protein
MKHENNGYCLKCKEIFDLYPGFNKQLRDWFIKFQMKHQEAHISCAGRNSKDQYDKFMRGLSRAKWGQSAHNWNSGLDLFVIQKDSTDIYPKAWFKKVLEPELPAWISWLGREGSPYYELAHIEISNWNEMAKQRVLSLVENKPSIKS